MKSFDALERNFRRLQLATEIAGFHNRPAFMRAEESHPSLLEDFGMWVIQKPRIDPERTASLVEAAVARVAAVADAAGPGRCQDLSTLLAHLLDALGVFNFIAAGSAIVLENGQYVAGLHAHNYKDPGATSVGHFWVCAPPYFVADVSLANQHGLLGQLPIPKTLLAREVDTKYPISREDMIAPRARLATVDLHPYASFASKFGVSHCDIGRYQVRYVPAGVKAPDTVLEEWQDFLSIGESPASFVSRNASELMK